VTAAAPGPTVLVVGEALVDVVPTPAGPSLARAGGSPANVAVGLARLGVPVHLLTRYGTDPHGALLAEALASNGVGVVLEPDALPTGVAVATLGPQGHARYDVQLDWQLPADLCASGRPPATASHLHTGSLAAILTPGAREVRQLVEQLRASTSVSYDPNCRPAQMGAVEDVRPQVEAFVAASDIVKASAEDVRWLYPARDLRSVAADWLAAGPALVVVTRGARGAYALARGGAVEVPAPRVSVVDTVGAGDAFLAALLAAFAARGLLGVAARAALAAVDAGIVRASLVHAAAAAALTCEWPGAQLPSAAELPGVVRRG